MSLIVEGHGFSISHGIESITQEPISVGFPGFERAELDRTTQGNSAVKTARAADLRKYENFTHQFPYDPADYATWESACSNGSESHVITFPGGGTLTIYAEVMSIGDITQETDGRPVYDVTFLTTNLDGTSETAPSYSAES